MIVNVEQSSFSRIMFTVGRLVRIKYFVESDVISEAGFNNAFYCIYYVSKNGGGAFA